MASPGAGSSSPTPGGCWPWRPGRTGPSTSATSGPSTGWSERPRDATMGTVEVLDTFLDAMGRTPLVRLQRVATNVQPTVLAKLEMLNPGGSVKDRIGLRMIEAAERGGHLKPGGTIVEPTSGNTGHGLDDR